MVSGSGSAAVLHHKLDPNIASVKWGGAGSQERPERERSISHIRGLGGGGREIAMREDGGVGGLVERGHRTRGDTCIRRKRRVGRRR